MFISQEFSLLSILLLRRSASSWNILYFEKKAHGNFNVQSRPFIAKAAVETCRRTSLAFEAWKPELHIHMYYTVVVYSTTYTYVVCRSSHLCLFRSYSAATPLTQCSKTAIMIRKFEKGKFLNFEIFFSLKGGYPIISSLRRMFFTTLIGFRSVYKISSCC